MSESTVARELVADGAATPSDSDVITRSLVEPDLFAAIFDRHFRAVHRYVHRRAGSDIADEVAAETFRVGFERRARWSQAMPDARPWLLGIATNLLRRHRRVEERRLRALARQAVDPWATLDEGAVAERADAARAQAALAAALAALSPADRDVVTLVALADLTHAEAARALGIPPGTVASRLHRARETLARILAEAEEEDPDG